MTRAFTLTLVLFLASSIAYAEDCKLEDTVSECESKIDDSKTERPKALADKLKSETSATSKKVVKEANTGVQAGALGSTRTDFLSALNLIGLISGGNGDDMTGDVIRFEYTVFDPEVFDLGGKLNLSFDSAPSLSDAIRSALPEENRDEEASALEGELQLYDDISISVEIATRERTINANQDVLDALFKGLLKQTGTQLTQEQRTQRSLFSDLLTAMSSLALLPECAKGTKGDLNSCTFRELAEQVVTLVKAGEWVPIRFQGACRSAQPGGIERCGEEIMALYETRRLQDFAYIEELKLEADRLGLDKFAALVDNEPQFVFSLNGQVRDDLVGADQLEAKISYQRGGPSLTGFENLDQLPDRDSSDYLEAFRRYVANNQRRFENRFQWSLEASYTWVDSLEESRPDVGLMFMSEAVERWSIGGALSVALQTDESNMPLTRLDLVASWQDFSDDEMRQDRFVASLTLTKAFGTMSVPFGLVYASKSEFLVDESDHQLSARFGIKFKLPDLGGGE